MAGAVRNGFAVYDQGLIRCRQALTERVAPLMMRAHPRVETAISATVRLTDGRTYTSAEIRNISLGGVFIEMPEPLGFGSEFDLEFKLPATAQVIRCRGLVVWNTKAQPEKGEGRPGMGVRLMKIGVQEMRVISEYVTAQLET